MGIPKDRPLALIILDGWGHSARSEGNAIALAHTPYYDDVCARFPKTTLTASGIRVGQSPESAGNPEVGHVSIGTGRPATSESFRIEDAIQSGSFFENEALTHAFAQAFSNGRPVHLIGMLSDAGVHSSIETIFGLLRMAKRFGVTDVFIHGILDGVDVPNRTADIYVEALEIKLADIGVGRVATLCGRYFAMDSQGNWERTARAYTMLVHAEGDRSEDAVSAIRNSFLRGITDEFTAPIVLETELGTPVARITEGDTIIYFNHRAESMRQLVRSLSVPDALGSAKPTFNSVCMTEYDQDFGLSVAFRSERSSNGLTEVLASAGIQNVKISQSERFPHITYFFNGGRNTELEGEKHVLLPTPRSETADQQPESQSFKIVDTFIHNLESAHGGVYVVNIPAGDLAAKTGKIEKTVEAIQYIDTCIGGIVEHVRAAGGVTIITSSHGNCEEMSDVLSGEPHGTSTSNPVPFHLIADGLNGTALRSGGSLADVAPTILAILGVEKPDEMTGSDLRTS
ncbi:MAG TPA: 2,3-bisphosphoglycerate-independent phosphoglycerate mutase [Pyrinomonadaceae bacterium]|nr:2,3-bisphosphoglycerate-independent phosphoglycerate mutase [Chloracidobacterium sp.]MBP9935858.1 2,3-bisphosphoglycerate-independent phosphoglycerate mutase [Pyrinomonadaceae bacterium]MBK7802391.1 2,3-bisphosphoglycerate-independent phosphoglycerate mutase [Chloracidobacterium sp.]MBK9437259.1 2,3-bisphosphoglycerate-independent phosphoglycerate mutase [Chloracidobacterium sp.]MBK9765995.1 2,3-bisphosphoglycerate-independent phosphoglycerate mutase [Chloracidobacterium sp.]